MKLSNAEILALSTKDQISYWLGCFLVAIGRGDLRSEIFSMMNFYQLEAYNRGVEAGKTANKEVK